MYLGLCINNDDPEKRGRVQIFIPHVMPALYDGWTKEGADIQLNCVGDNLPQGLTADIVERLVMILPWAECASPVLGTSAPGNLYPGNTAAGAQSTVGGASRSSGAGNYYDQSPVPQPIKGAAGGGLGTAATPIGAASVGSDAALLQKAKQYAGSGGLGAKVRNNLDGTRGTGACGRGTVAVVGALTGNSRFTQGTAGGNAQDFSANGGLSFTSSGIYNNKQGLPAGYLSDRSQWRVGDIVASDSRGYGHIQVWTGKQWVSDFQQGDNVLQNGYSGHALHRLNAAGEAAVQANSGLLGGITNAAGGTAAPGASSDTTASQETTSVSNDSLAAPAQAECTPPTFQQGVPERQYGNVANQYIDNSAAGQAGNVATGQAPTLGGTGAYGIPSINDSDVSVAGSTQSRKVSVYGSVYDDLTSLIDVKPSQRPADAIAKWGADTVARNEADMQRRGMKTGTLNLAWTGQGSQLGGKSPYNGGNSNLTPGFSVGVAKAYGLKAGQFIKVTNSAGQPVGPNGGYFQVSDTGSESNLTRMNAIDFYTGKDQGLKGYFNGLNKAGEGINVTPVNISGQSLESLKSALAGQKNWALEGETGATDTSSLAGAAGLGSGSGTGSAAEQMAGQQSTCMVQNTDPHGPSASQGLNGVAKGVFSYPAPGAMLWVFHREGNPLYPVYFAASYGQAEWQSAYKYSSPGPGYNPVPQNGEPQSTGGIINLNGVGGIRWEDTNVLDDRTKDQKSIMLFGEDGSNLFFGKGYSQFISKFDRRDVVEGDRFETTLGQKEQWVQGDYNKVVLGDYYLKVGNVSQRALEAVQQIQEHIKTIQQPLIEGGTNAAGGSGGGSSSGSSLDGTIAQGANTGSMIPFEGTDGQFDMDRPFNLTNSQAGRSNMQGLGTAQNMNIFGDSGPQGRQAGYQSSGVTVPRTSSPTRSTPVNNSQGSGLSPNPSSRPSLTQ